MRRIRLYCDPADFSLQSGFCGELDPRNTHYLKNVLRVRAEQALVLFDGEGHEYQAKVKTVGRRDIEIEIGNQISRDQSPESELNIQLGIGISKGERMDWVMQKATEMGVAGIHPLSTQRCDVKLDASRMEKKLGHWKSVLVSATEQSNRVCIPGLNSPVRFDEFAEAPADLKLLFDPNGIALTAVARDLPAPTSVAIAIGPEGGFCEEELAVAENSGFRICSMGPRVLRTETAPVAALAVIQQLWGDF